MEATPNYHTLTPGYRLGTFRDCGEHFVVGTLFGFLVAVGGIWGVFFWLGRDDLQNDPIRTSLARSRALSSSAY